MTRTRHFVSACCALGGLLSLVSLVGCQQPQATSDKASDAAVAVTASPPVRKTLTRVTTQPGHIEAFEQTPIYAMIEGYVRKTRTATDKNGKPAPRELAEMGDHVEAGEVLAEVAVPQMEQELKQKVAQVGQATAAIDQAKSAITRTEGEYQRSKAERERIDKLAASGSVSRKLADEAENQFRAAEGARQEATARLAVAKAQLEVAQADEGHLRALLEYSQVRAPFAGIITERNVDTGHLVRAPQGATARPLFVVARMDRVRVFVEVPEAEAPLVRAGSPAVVRVPALDDAEFPDRVKCTSWLLDRVSRTLRTEVDLPNTADHRLQPGMYVNVRIVLAERRDVVTLPAGSIGRDGQQSYCYSVESDQLVRKPITLGLRVNDDVEIASGLSGDELVVRDNPTSLRPNQAAKLAGGSQK